MLQYITECEMIILYNSNVEIAVQLKSHGESEIARK